MRRLVMSRLIWICIVWEGICLVCRVESYLISTFQVLIEFLASTTVKQWVHHPHTRDTAKLACWNNLTPSIWKVSIFRQVHLYSILPSISFRKSLFAWRFCHDSVQQRLCTNSFILFHYEKTPIQIYWKFHHQNNENFQIKKSNIFHSSAQNIDCWYSLEPPRRGGSNEFPQSMFLSKIRKIMYTPVNPSFTI